MTAAWQTVWEEPEDVDTFLPGVTAKSLLSSDTGEGGVALSATGMRRININESSLKGNLSPALAMMTHGQTVPLPEGSVWCDTCRGWPGLVSLRLRARSSAGAHFQLSPFGNESEQGWSPGGRVWG